MKAATRRKLLDLRKREKLLKDVLRVRENQAESSAIPHATLALSGAEQHGQADEALADARL